MPALNIIRKDSHYEQTKHINNYFKYAKQQNKDGNIYLKRLLGVDMPADGLTKPLKKTDHAKFLHLLNIALVPRI
jgi:hypothetical protein